jgi:NADH-quinone oxidoreductase subunit N
MSIHDLSLLRFEGIITLIIFILLLMKLNETDQSAKSFMIIVNVLLGLNFAAGLLPIDSGSLFVGFFKTSGLIALEKNILNLGLFLISLTSWRWALSKEHRIEFYILLLASMLGVFAMLSSGHILMLYMGLEMSTIPVAALANFNKSKRNSSEAGIKLILSSAFSTGMMLFGISLLYGAVGNLSFEWVSTHLQANPLTILAFSFILGGFAFKMSIVPFHLWTADVYEGSPVAVTNYLSVISKGSVIFIFITVMYAVFGGLKDAWLYSIGILSILSMTIGNLFAMRQMNIKRLLAFSSITQVGFVLVGIAGASKMGITSAVYFILIYMLSNVAAFGVVGAIVDSTEKESLVSYKGLYKSNPFYALILALCLFSLAGIPPTAGFFGKLFLLTSGISSGMYVLLAFAAINLVFSLYNYLRVVRIMFIETAEEPLPVIEKNFTLSLALIICIIGILAIGFISPIYNFIDSISIL